ncbi:MAG: hypothetical protein ABI920_11940 [Casimicrobiaceae bacterium]
MNKKLLIAALAAVFATGVLAQDKAPAPEKTSAGAGTPATAKDPENRPGGTSSIPPTRGPATAPALPSPNLPQVTIDNREKAEALKAARKARKAASKKGAKKATEKAAPAPRPFSPPKPATEVPAKAPG